MPGICLFAYPSPLVARYNPCGFSRAPNARATRLVELACLRYTARGKGRASQRDLAASRSRRMGDALWWTQHYQEEP